MNYLGESRKQSRKKKGRTFQVILIIIAIITSIYLLANIDLPVLSNISGAIVSGIDTVASSISGLVKEGTSYFGNVSNLKEQNDNLSKELDELKLHILELKKIEIENSELREALEIDEKYNHFNKIYANIILRDYSNWNETFTINKGSKDGIKLKQTVVSSDGLVGYISSVTETTSIVTTIMDPNTSVSVEIATINELALLKGDFDLKNNGQMKLTNIPINSELSVGEKIYTTGISTMYQKGLIIGEIKEVINKKNEVDRYAIIEPYTDFSSLDFVAVIVE